MAADQDRRIAEIIEREGGRLKSFIKKRVADAAEAEDILQDAFSELVEAYRLMRPIEQAGAWLYRVARNRIVDRFRRKREEPLGSEEEQDGSWEDALPSPDAGPDAEYARGVLMEELEHAIDELSDDQREVFLAHEVIGKSFKEISLETGVGVSTLLSRKRYAVLHLRRRLREIYEDFS